MWMLNRITHQTQTGGFFIAFGCIFTFLSFVFALDSGLLALGNILLLPGIVLLRGVRKSFYCDNIIDLGGSLLILLGLLVMLYFKFVCIGFGIETFGMFLLVKSFFQKLLNIICFWRKIGYS